MSDFTSLSHSQKLQEIIQYFLENGEHDNSEDNVFGEYVKFLKTISVEQKEKTDLSDLSDEKKDQKVEKDEFSKLPDKKQEDKIIEFLKGYSEPVKTLEIARKFYGEKGVRKDINSRLYSMEKKNLIVKSSSSNGTDPRWSIVSK